MLARRGAGDPIVNGFTRTASGVQTEATPQLGAAGPGSNQAKFYPLPGARAGDTGTVEAVATQVFDDLGPEHALVGVAYAGPPNILLFHGTALVPTSAELWVNNLKVAQNAVQGGSRRFKIAREPGRVRAWVDGALIYDGAPAGAPALATAQLFIQTDNNPGHLHASTGYWTQEKVTSGNTLGFKRCPSNGSVVVNVNGGADQIVQLDVAGSGALDMGGTTFPVKARYRVYDGPGGTGTLLADLTIPYAYGGDVLGLLAASTTPANPATFQVQRQSTGLLFRDDFNRADGAPGANYVIESGAWSIVGGKLVANVVGNVTTQMRLANLANRLNMHAQMTVSRSALQLFMTMLNRRVGNTWYQFHVAASNDGANPNQPRISRSTAGAGATIATAPAFGTAANVAERWTLSTINKTQKAWVNGANLATGADGTAGNQIAGGFALQGFGNGGVSGTATLDDLVICAERSIAVLNVPIGYKVRVGALVSAPSTGDVVLDLAGSALPAAQLEILDGADVVQRTLAPADGVWGGDLYLCQ